MSLERARIIKGAFAEATPQERRSTELARRVAADVLDAKRIAANIVADAKMQAARIVEDAHASAGAVMAKVSLEAREAETARLAAGFLALRAQEDARATRELDRTIELAVLLAERLVGESLRVAPERIAELAAAALEEARGARQVRIEAAPDDVAPLAAALSAIGQVATIDPDPSLRRGSLVLHTDLGQVDAKLEPQLARLAVALREALQ